MSRLAAIILVVFLVFGHPVRSFFGTADLMAAVAVATAGAALAAVLVAIVVLTTRRRRAAAGGCVTCQFQCQHAMTGPRGRSWLVSTVDRDQHRHVPAHPVNPMNPMTPVTPAVAGGPGPRTLLPIQPVIRVPAQVGPLRPVRVHARAGAPQPVRTNGFEDFAPVPAGMMPHWPDRPVHRADQALSGQRAT